MIQLAMQRIRSFLTKSKYKIFIYSSLFFILICILLGSWNVINNDLNFHSDIARDFLLLEEMQKKPILIGPRASGMDGVFHGPLWLYINYPAFYLAKGNPVIVGWFWIALTIAALFFNFILARKVFNQKTAIIFILLFSVQLIEYMNNLYNPVGALFIIPLFYYLILKYVETTKARFLIAQLFVAGLLIQFQMAIGVPLLILATGIDLFFIVKNKRYNHLLSFIILLIPLASFFLFELRHNFGQTQAVIKYISGNGKYGGMDLISSLSHRLHLATIVGLHFFKGKMEIFNIIPSYILAFFLFYSIKKKNQPERNKYLLFAYLYIGYYVLSLLHNGWVLKHYWFPLISLIFMIFASLTNYIKSKWFYSFIIIILFTNLITSFQQKIDDSKFFIGKEENSWQFQLKMLKTLYRDASEDFGLYLYSPDILGYQMKYAVLYGQRLNPGKKVSINNKKTVTYVITASPPNDRPDMNGSWWIINKVGITKKPTKIISFANGYKILKYNLLPKETLISSDPDLNDWLHYR